MDMKPIRRSDWSARCREFSEGHRGHVIRLFAAEAPGALGSEFLAVEAPLRQVALEGGGERFAVAVDRLDGKPEIVVLERPERLLEREPDNGHRDGGGLRVEAEDGTALEVRLGSSGASQ
jgi:hypothetical protein